MSTATGEAATYQRLRAHLKQSLSDALSIANPKWLTR